MTQYPRRTVLEYAAKAAAATLLPGDAGFPTSTDITVLAEFSVYSDSDLLLVPVRIAGQEFTFVLDTGASLSVFDSSLLPLLGGALEGASLVNGERPVQMVRWPTATLGAALPLPRGTPAFCWDLTDLREASGHEIRGILGFDWLRGQVVRIDFERGRLQILESGRQPADGIPISLLNSTPNGRGKPSVHVDIAGIGDTISLINTGFDGSLAITPNVFDKLWRSALFIRSGASNRGLVTTTGTKPTRRGLAGSVRMGSHTHGEVLACEFQGPMCVLGLGLLSKYAVTLDFPNAMMSLDSPRQLSAPDNGRQSGVSILRREGRTLIDHVDPGTPGNAAGLAAGDEIVRIAEEKAGPLRLFTIRKLLCTGADPVTLDICRDAEMRMVKIEPR